MPVSAAKMAAAITTVLLVNLTSFTGTKIVYGATQTKNGGDSGYQALQLINLP